MTTKVNTIGIKSISLLRNKAYVNGEWVGARSEKTFNVMNPATGEVVGSVPNMDIEDVQQAIKAANSAFPSWSNKTAKERSVLLRKWYDSMQVDSKKIAEIITLEVGKPLAESISEVAYGNSFIDWFSIQARRVYGEFIESPTRRKEMVFIKQPIGVAALITPWNFPHAMITRKAGAALAAGCTCVIKPSEDTPFAALALCDAAERVKIPKGVINVVTSDRSNTPSVGKILCESPLIAGVSFTGSTEVGKLLYKQCANGVKRINLELGGNAPFIVFDNADIDKAVDGAIASKFRNCGQTCVSPNRFLVHDVIHDEFVTKMEKRILNMKLGNGLNPGIDLGPLINKAAINKVEDLVKDAVSKGAKVVCGGEQARDVGDLFYKPTLLTGVSSNMLCYHEEIFGPVVACMKFKTEDEALALANDTNKGLSGYFYSSSPSQIWRVAKKLEMGMLGVNEGIISTAEGAFGGIKESGLGREGSHHGIEEYVYIKYICFETLQS